MTRRKLLSRLLLIVVSTALGMFFVLPLLWFFVAPFNPEASLAVSWPTRFSFSNFTQVFANNVAIRALIVNSPIIAGGAMVGTALVAALTAYGLSRSRIPGKSVLTTVLILFSSVVTGTASMIPIFLLMFTLRLIDTHIGVILVMIGGLIPSAVFIMEDFVESIPRSYEEAAMVQRRTTAARIPRGRVSTDSPRRDGRRDLGVRECVGCVPDAVHPAALLR